MPSRTPRRRARLGRLAAHAAVVAVIGLLEAAAPGTALGARQVGPADLSIALVASSHRARPGQWIFFTVKVTNHGPGSAVGATIIVLTRGGLLKPTLIGASYDIVPSCTAIGLLSIPSCRPRWVAPNCSLRRVKLTCRYANYEIPPAPARGSSLTLVVKAKAGRPGRERAVAIVGGADDPNPANNRA